MAKPTTLCLVHIIIISHGWFLHQLNVNHVFLQGHIMEDMYMAQPLGFVGPNYLSHVCKLCKTIYDLKNASHTCTWRRCIRSKEENIGFDIYIYIYIGNLIL